MGTFIGIVIGIIITLVTIGALILRWFMKSKWKT